MTNLGCELIYCKLNKSNKLNLKNIFKKIYSLNIADVLVEAGGIFFRELIDNKLVDEVHVFKSKIIIGENGKPAINGKKLEDLKISLKETKNFRDDLYLNYSVN